MAMAENKEKKVLNVPNLRFPEFKEEWKKCRFKDVVRLFRGSSPRPIIEYLTTDNEEGVNWVKIGDVPTSGRIITSTEEKITKEGAKKSRHVYVGDLILSNSMSYGLPYIMGIEGCIHDGWFVLRDYEQNFNKDYLCDLLISDIVQKQYKKIAAGGVVQNISSDLVNSVYISIPSLDEQRKIAGLLSLIDERIATQNKVIEDLKKLKCAIIEKHYRQAKLHKYKICDLGVPFSVGSLSKEDLSEKGHECILYGELFTTYDCVINEIKSHTNKIANMTLSQKRDLLFPSSTTVDAVSLISPSVIDIPNVVLGGDMFGIHIDKKFNAYYLSYYINIITRKILAIYAKGSTIIHLHYKDIAKAQLLLPDLCEQDRIAKCMMAEDDKIKVEEQLMTKLEEQKQYLLRQMFI